MLVINVIIIVIVNNPVIDDSIMLDGFVGLIFIIIFLIFVIVENVV